MARTAGKKQSKPAPQTSTSQTTTTSSASSTFVPEPFVLVPAQLRPLTSTLPTDHVFAVHIDRNAIALKKRVYTVPILLNIVIAAILCVRIYFAAPVYLDQIITIFGFETAWKVEPQGMGYQDIINTITNRTGLLMMDYAIFAFLGSWPWEFLFGSKYSRHTGAWGWRRNIGFKDTEIVVRRGRKWDDKLFSADDKKWSREDELAIQFKVEPALRKSYTEKTGYLLLDKDWDLDFKGMIDAHRLVEKGRIDLKDLDHIVLVYYQKQWLLWRVHQDIVPTVLELQDDARVRAFREKLTALGREDVFFRWIEIIQYETSKPGGFTEANKTASIEELKRLLTDRKVDFDKFMDDVGGKTGLPGITK